MGKLIDACELGEEAKTLVDLARKWFGDDLPVIKVVEDNAWMPFKEESYKPNYYGEYYIDMKLLEAELLRDGLVVGNIRYVASILEAALDGSAGHECSRKYSFGDTPDWWGDIICETTENRKFIEINVSVYW